MNLHPAEIRDPELVAGRDHLVRVLDRVVFDIRESAGANFAQINGDLEALRRLGFQISIDDIGPGYRSLSSVVLLQPSFLKLPGVLTRELRESKGRLDLIRRAIDIAHTVEAKVIATELESESDAELCEIAGCDLFTGYLFGEPSVA